MAKLTASAKIVRGRNHLTVKVKTAKYNGLNFSKSFLRESDLIDYSLQRKKNYLPATELKYLSFFVEGLNYAFELANYKIYAVVGGVETSITASSYLTVTGTSGVVFFVMMAVAFHKLIQTCCQSKNK